jgi:hypothetical protein
MTEPDEIISDGTRTVSRPGIKRERPEDEEPARRVAQRIEHVQEEEVEEEEISDESMRKIVIEDLRIDDEISLGRALKRLDKYLLGKDQPRFVCWEKQRGILPSYG